MVSVVRKLREVHLAERALGVMALLSNHWRWRSIFFTGLCALMETPAIAEPAISKTRLAAYELSWLAPQELPRLMQIVPEHQQLRIGKLFARFMDQGARTALIEHEGRVVAYNWVFAKRYTVTFDSHVSRNLELQLPDECVFFGNGYIDPKYRMHGLFPRLLAHSSTAFGSARRCFSSTDIFNSISMASHLRLGFRRVGTVACTTWLGHTSFHSRASPDTPWRHIAGDSLELIDSTAQEDLRRSAGPASAFRSSW